MASARENIEVAIKEKCPECGMKKLVRVDWNTAAYLVLCTNYKCPAFRQKVRLEFKPGHERQQSLHGERINGEMQVLLDLGISEAAVERERVLRMAM